MPGMQEWLIIAVIALLVFGPERLPELARNAGRLLARLRSETQANVNELKQLSEVQELRAELRGLEREFRDSAGQLGARGTGSAPRSSARRSSAAADTSTGESSTSADGPAPPTDPEAT